MANTLTLLYYANSRWNQLKNRIENPGFDDNVATTPTNKPYIYKGGNPILSCNITDMLGAPLEIELVLNNRQSQPRSTFSEPNANYTFGEDPLVNPQLGQFHDLISEHTEILVHENDTFMTLFAGRVYVTDEMYDISSGSVLLLTGRDELETVSASTLNTLTDEEGNIRLMENADPVPANDVSNGGDIRYARNKLDLIRYTVEQSVGLQNIEIPDVDSTNGIIIPNASGSVTSDKIDHNVVTNDSYYTNFDEAYINSKKKGDKATHDLRVVQESPLVHMQTLAQEQKYLIDGEAQFGWTFHLDGTRRSPIHQGSESIIKPKQDFVYFRRGHNPTAEPLTKGLVVKYATEQLVESDTPATTDRYRNMFQNGFEFKGIGTQSYTHITLRHKVSWKPGPAENLGPVTGGKDLLFTHASNSSGNIGGNQANQIDEIKTHRGIEKWASLAAFGYTYDLYEYLDGDSNTLKDEVEEEFAIIYIKPQIGTNNATIGTFSVNLPDTNAYLQFPRPHVKNRKRRSFNQVSSLHTVSKASGNQAFRTRAASVDHNNVTLPAHAQTWLGNVQSQGEDEDGNYFLILSHPQHKMLSELDNSQLLYERSHYWDLPRAVNTNRPAGGIDQEVIVRLATSNGYPANNRGKRTLELSRDKIFFDDSFDELRSVVMNNFLKSTKKDIKRLRKGLFTLKDYPHVRWGGTAAVSSGGSTLYLDQSSLTQGGQPTSSGITPSTPYGMRRGCSLVKSGTTSGGVVTQLTGNNRNVGYIDTTSANTVVGSIYPISELEEASPEIGAWASGDKYSVHVPYRTGMTIRCENLLAGINGDFLINQIKYSWNNGRVGSELEVIGINDAVVFKSRSNISVRDADFTFTKGSDERIVDPAALAANAYTTTIYIWSHESKVSIPCCE